MCTVAWFGCDEYMNVGFFYIELLDYYCCYQTQQNKLLMFDYSYITLREGLVNQGLLKDKGLFRLKALLNDTYLSVDKTTHLTKTRRTTTRN